MEGGRREKSWPRAIVEKEHANRGIAIEGRVGKRWLEVNRNGALKGRQNKNRE